MHAVTKVGRSVAGGGRAVLAKGLVAASILAGLALVLSPSIALAQAASDEPSCGSEISGDADVPDGHSLLGTVAHFTPDFVFPQGSDFPAVLAGKARFPDEGTQSTVLFVGPRIGGPSSDSNDAADVQVGWRGYYVQEQASFTKAFASPQAGRAILFSMMSVEGPGHEYQVISTDDALRRSGAVPFHRRTPRWTFSTSWIFKPSTWMTGAAAN